MQAVSTRAGRQGPDARDRADDLATPAQPTVARGFVEAPHQEEEYHAARERFEFQGDERER